MQPPPELTELIRDAGLVVEHPPAVQEETRRWEADPGIEDPTLVDLTDLPFVTIDEPTSRDLDQALCIETRPARGWRVWYAVADAAWFVRPGTALFAEALARGSTYYLPGLVVPMLPPALSEGLVSLNPGVPRRAMVFCVELAADGTVEHTSVIRGRIRSRVKTSYGAVQAWRDGTAPCPGDEAVDRSLRALSEVGRHRRALADTRDVISFRRVELAVHLDDADRGFVGMRDLRNDVERDNEQVSLLCNVEGARLLAAGHPEVQPIYRTHAPPRPERLDALSERIATLVTTHRLDPAIWAWRPGGRSLKDYLAGLPRDGHGGRIAQAIHRQAMLSGGSAIFTSRPGAHFGIGAEVYARFTAPMREVVGVFVHKEAWEAKGAPPTPTADDERLREQVIEASQRARRLQRSLDHQVNRLVIDDLFAGDLARPTSARPRRRGTVMGISSGKIHVLLDDPPIDVKVYGRHVSEARGAGVRIDRYDATLRDAASDQLLAAVGDAVDVVVLARDATSDRWALGLVAERG